MQLMIKYCGGCNARCDRVGLVNRLKRDFPSLVLLPAQENTEADAVAVVCGCRAACAAHEGLKGSAGKIILTGPEDYQQLYRLIDGVYNKEE